MRRKANISNKKTKTLDDIRKMLNRPSYKDPVSKKEATIGKLLREKYQIK